MKQLVYITTVKDESGLRGAVCDAHTREVVAMTERIDPPHIKVALARAQELVLERAMVWHVVEEPRQP